MSINLAELTALIQDQIQKSFEYGEQMATIGRDSDQSELRMKLCEAEVDLPVEFSLDEVSVSRTQVKKLIESGSSIDVASQLLKLPKVDKKFEFALKDRMTIDTLSEARARALADEPSSHEAVAAATETKKQPAKAQLRGRQSPIKESAAKEVVTLPEILTEVHTERAKKLPWNTMKGKKFPQLSVAQLTPEKTSSQNPVNISGRISLKFKADIK